MGGGGVSVPGPSAEERELQKQQAETLKLQREILTQQRQQQQVLVPFLAEQEGFKAETDAFGNITKIAKIPDPLDATRKELQKGLLYRSLAALKGELPVDPALEKSLSVNEQQIRERLQAQLGPGFETSTAGIQSLEEFRRSAETLRFGARTQTLSLAEQLGITRDQQDIFRRQSAQDVLQHSVNTVPLGLAGGFGQNAQGFGQAQQPFIQQRQMELQAAIANSQQKSQGFGQAIGAIGAIGSLFSDERLKENLVQIGTHSRLKIPIYTFNYVGDINRYMGVLAEDVAAVQPGSVYERGGYSMVQYGDL